MGRRPLGKVAVTRRISPAYVAMLEKLEAAGFDLESVIAMGHALIWTAATHTGYDPFELKKDDPAGLYGQMNALMAKELYGESWAKTFDLMPQNFKPFDEVYMDRIRRNLEKHRAYNAYLDARRRDQEDKREPPEPSEAQGTGGQGSGVEVRQVAIRPQPTWRRPHLPRGEVAKEIALAICEYLEANPRIGQGQLHDWMAERFPDHFRGPDATEYYNTEKFMWWLHELNLTYRDRYYNCGVYKGWREAFAQADWTAPPR